MLIHRPLYTWKIQQYKWNWTVKVITWQRRSWKSILLLQTLDTYQKNYFIDMELFENRKYKDKEYFYTSLKEALSWKIDAVWIDEIQAIQWREEVILSLIKEYPDVDFYVTWSNSYMVSSELSTLLRGRHSQIHVYPFWFEEYCSLHAFEWTKESYMSYLEIWGFATIYNIDSSLHKERLKNLINTVFFKDVVERYWIRNGQLLEELFLFVVDNVWSPTSFDSIRKKLKQQSIHTSVPTLQEYMGYLIWSYLVYPVEIYDIQWKGLFDRLKKYYPSDHNRRKVLLWNYNEWIWQIVEVQVYFELLRKGRTVTVWSHKKWEIDFIATKWDDTWYIQVAYILQNKETIEREFWSFKTIKDNYPKFVISTDEISLWNINWIKHLPIREFITLL